MKILLTGNAGFIGKELMLFLSQKHNVIGYDIKNGHNLIDCDLTEDFDLVVHLAGLSGVRDSFSKPGEYWLHNVEVSKRLFDRYGYNTRILFASSSSAYEPELNPYAASKYIVEKAAEKFPDTLAMRFHTVYSGCPREGMFVYKLLNNTLEYTTNHYRDFIHLRDLCVAIDLCIESYYTGIIDIGTGRPVSVSSLAPDLPIRTDTYGERKKTCADTSLMKNLGFEPKYYIEEFLADRDASKNYNEIFDC